MRYYASIYCEQWSDGPAYDYGSAYGTDETTFAKSLRDALEQCDRFARSVAYLEVRIGDNPRETLTRSEVEQRWLKH